jgi:hypothetical protein
MACAGRGTPTRTPPSHPPSAPIRLWTDFGSLAKSRGWPPFWSLWVWKLNSWGAEIEFLSFHRIKWKFARPPRIWTPAGILACQAGTTSRYSTGETPPIKAERPELGSHLGSTSLRGSTSTRIWTRALQPDQEEVSSCRFRRAQIVSGHQTFPQTFWLGAEIFARHGDFNAHQGSIVRLYFYQAPIFCIPA